MRNINEECGVFGIFNHPNASELTYFALQALQHRGQEGAGIVTSDGNILKQYKGMGLVNQIFTETKLKKLRGQHSIGHVSYTTSGDGNLLNVQPFLFHSQTGQLALCHNGNIVNSKAIKHHLENNGSIFQTTSDSEVLAHLVKKQRGTFIERLKESLVYLEGAFAFLLLLEDELFIALDKHGLRPLSIGKIDNAYVVASETCAFETIGAKFIRDVLPGEVIRISETKMETSNYAINGKCQLCAMEYIYFSRPDSELLGNNVHAVRKRCGINLANEAPVDADVVIGVPDSGMSSAIGFAEKARIPFELGIIKNKYIGRTFIEPSQKLRDLGVKLKLSAVRSLIENKNVVLIDDSIVRGTTIIKLVKMLKVAGAKAVHVRIAAPIIKFPCFYGVDFTTYQELIGAKHKTDAIRVLIGADSLAYLSLAGLIDAIGNKNICSACFNGEYPTHLYEKIEKANLERK